MLHTLYVSKTALKISASSVESGKGDRVFSIPQSELGVGSEEKIKKYLVKPGVQTNHKCLVTLSMPN